MKQLILAVMVGVIGMRGGVAAPVQVHNKLVFTRGESSRHTETVWTMSPDGSGARQVWHVPTGYGHFGGFSYDGKQAISCNQFNLYVHDLKTGHFRRLLVWSGGWSPEIEDTAFSPDNNHIVCTVSSASTSDNEASVLVLDANRPSSVSQVIVRPSNADLRRFPYFQDVSWSSDGKHLIAVGGRWQLSWFNGTNLEVWVMNIDGSQGHQITDNQFWESQPAWNSSIDKIAFTRLYPDIHGDYANDRGSDLFIRDANGTKEKRLTQNKQGPEDLKQDFRIVSKPLFSPDGTKIAFNLMNSGDADPGSTIVERNLFYQNWIYSIGSDGQHQKRLGQGTLIQWLP